jgi:uncharacterized protein (TIGR03435 family)
MKLPTLGYETDQFGAIRQHLNSRGVLPGLGRLDRPVADRTGLSSHIDLMKWTREPNLSGLSDANLPLDQGPTFLEALREQFGLKLESTKAPMQVLVIDHIERHSEN